MLGNHFLFSLYRSIPQPRLLASSLPRCRLRFQSKL